MGKKSAAQFKVVPKPPGDSEIVAELTQQLELGKKAREDKLTQLVAHLKAKLEMTSEKYLTVNGFMQARVALDQVAFGSDITNPDMLTRDLARGMSKLAAELAMELSNMSIEDLDEMFLDGVLDKNFISGLTTMSAIAEQLLRVNLLQNIGPVVDEIMQFRASTDAGIASIEAALEEHKQNEADAYIKAENAKPAK